MPKLLKKSILLIVLFLAFFCLKKDFVLAANPQDIFYNNSIERFNKDKRDCYEKAAADNAPCVSNAPVDANQKAASAYNFIGNIINTDPEFAYNNDKKTAMGTITNIMASIYSHPPASGIEYAYDVLHNSGIIAKPAYAQGIGFAGLSPLLPLWKVSRNIAYSAIIIVMIAIGFMVMFRTKIDPKTVISVQAAIPKIVVTLILITLSYPIVGFMVDLMYLSMAIIISLIAQGIGEGSKTAEFQTYYMTAGVPQLLWTVISGGFSSWNDFFYPNLGLHGTTGVATAIAGYFKFFTLKLGTSILLMGAPDLIFGVILVLGILFTFVRILMLLLNSYIQLLLGLILGPLQLLFEAIPGRSVFSEWILNIMANLVVYPTTAAVLMFAQYLTQLNMDTGSLFSPPLTGIPGKGAFPAFLGLGVLFLAPTLIATVKKAFHPKPILPITMGTAFAPLTGGAQTAMGAASQFYYLKQTLAGFGKKDNH